jgi:prevent-host-death family protein
MQNPNQRGDIAEAAIAYAAMRLGVEVFRPAADHSRCDLVFGISSRLYRVQCKSASRKGEVLIVRLVSCRHTPSGYVRNTYTADEVDLVAAHCHELERTFLLPFSLFEGKKTGVHLRLSPPGNGQRAAIHYAADHELPGAVAQLERASGWQPEGRGFESHQLHSRARAKPTVVGAHEFRNQFGYFMQRAAAGETIEVTRRGRSFVRLSPPGERAAPPHAPRTTS